MWIICLGAKRSGSTLQYNIISKIVELSGSGIRIPFHKSEDFLLLKGKYKSVKGIKVIKTHQFGDSLKELVGTESVIYFHSYRDVRDVVVSYFKKGWAKKNDQTITTIVENYIGDYNKVKSNKEITICSRKYEEFAFNIKSESLEIAKQLGIQLTDAQLSEIEEELSIDRIKEKQKEISKENSNHAFDQTFDANTLIHDNHINDGNPLQYQTELTANEIVLIESIAWKWLITHGYILHFPKTELFLSLSQHADDYLAWQLLGKKDTGIVIEVGAFDGAHLSNSFSLAQKGWKSICVEPNPEIFNYLEIHRPNARNVNAAVVSKEGAESIDFFIEKTGVLSGCDYDEADVKRRHLNRGLKYVAPKKVQVKAKTLNSILKEQSILENEIDVISIDVEGFELEVLNGLDINHYKPILFIIEANDGVQKASILDFFSKYSDYVHIGDNHQNLFIMQSDKIDKKALRNLDTKNYIKARQYHPVEQSLSIEAILPGFRSTKAVKRIKRRFKLF